MARVPREPVVKPAPPAVEIVEAAPATGLRALFQPRLLIVLAALAAIPVFLPQWLAKLPKLAERPEYRLPVAKIHINPPPKFVPVDLVGQVQRLAGWKEDLSLLDSNLTADVAEAFAAHPWVSRVVQVKKAFPAAMDVQLEYRRPVALVEVTEGFHVVDADGILLPPRDFPSSIKTQLPIIRNVLSNPAGVPGTAWGDATVLAAARLAEVLEARWKKLELAAIVAPRPMSSNPDPTQMVFELVSTGGSKILWGRAPGTGQPGELTANQKLSRLTKYLAEFGSFDQPHGPYEIDIRHWQEISRRPLTASKPNGNRVRR